MGHTASHYRTRARAHEIASAEALDEQARMTQLELAQIFRARADFIEVYVSQQAAIVEGPLP